jgi:predicted Zn finger-like uncharacterized protein
MKIVCGSCQAKYSIADEKVAGKVFKIRCKRCGEVIVVRGDQEAAPEPAAGNGHAPANDAAYEAPSDAIWHVVINGEQAGPYAPSQLAELIHAGQLDWEAYVWCEGFENWQPMRDVAELVAAISGPQPQQEEPPPVRPARVPTQPGTPSMGADPFADEAPAQVAMYAKPAQAVGQAAAVGGGVSGAMAAHGATALSGTYDGGGGAKVVASGPRVSTEQAMTGARNENSVLFSLKNLQALATGSSAPAAPISQRPGYAGGEGSGLIDIRALATATGVNEQTKASSEKDALLSLGSAQAGAFGSLGSPMLAPPGRIEDDGSKKSLMMAILGGFLILAGAGVAIAIIMKPSAPPPQAIAPVAPVPPPPSAAATPAPHPSAAPAAAAPAAENNPAEPPSEGERAASERERAMQANAAKPSSENEEGRHGHHGRGRESASEKSAEAAPTPKASAAESEAKSEPPPKKHSGSGSIDDLLNDAIGGGKSGAKSGSSAAAAAASNLPEKPSRDDVLSAMNAIKGQVSACGKGQSGVAFANVTVIGRTGRVSNVEVTGMTGEVGSCIARTVRKAQFPKFKSDDFQVKFPFRM